MNKEIHPVIAYGIVGVLLVAIAGLFLPIVRQQTVLSTSTPGTTGSTAKIASVSLDLSTTTPSTVGGACKLYNSDSSDRIIMEIDYYLDPLGTFGFNTTGVANLTFQVGTSTDIYLASGNKVFNSTVSTTSAPQYLASTTPGLTGTNANRVWASGTCLNLQSNATSSTAGGTVVIRYFNN